MAPVEIKFLSPGWETNGSPAKDNEIVNPGDYPGKEFVKGKKHFAIECGIPSLGSAFQGKHLDNGGKVLFWDEGTKLNAPEGDSVRLDRDTGNIERVHALAEIRKGGSVKLIIDGENAVEIRHVPT